MLWCYQTDGSLFKDRKTELNFYLKVAEVFDPDVLPDIIEFSPEIFKKRYAKFTVAHVTNKSSNSSFLCNLNMAPATAAKRVLKVNVEKLKSSHSPAEKE